MMEPTIEKACNAEIIFTQDEINLTGSLSLTTPSNALKSGNAKNISNLRKIVSSTGAKKASPWRIFWIFHHFRLNASNNSSPKITRDTKKS